MDIPIFCRNWSNFQWAHFLDFSFSNWNHKSGLSHSSTSCSMHTLFHSLSLPVWQEKFLKSNRNLSVEKFCQLFCTSFRLGISIYKHLSSVLEFFFQSFYLLYALYSFTAVYVVYAFFRIFSYLWICFQEKQNLCFCMRADFRQYIGAKNNKITKLKINDELSRRKRLMSFGLGRIFHQIQYKQLTMLNRP